MDVSSTLGCIRFLLRNRSTTAPWHSLFTKTALATEKRGQDCSTRNYKSFGDIKITARILDSDV
jgi:hypothetical protein